ncbi:helix-loop-helix protein 11 [Orussus abietinus]|uniref:helix-loop-helix protein 11 n=1 Tax=Orussus abietinus TaxID=222816 RepID=UPI0006257480|nr:helix-loop-helix protein 11 [Orussus abietinus]
MSVFAPTDERILLEEIVEATEDQEADFCGASEIAEESPAATSAVEVAEAVEHQQPHHEDPQQQQRAEPQPQLAQQTTKQSHVVGGSGGGAAACRAANQGLALVGVALAGNAGPVNHGNAAPSVGRVTPRSHMEQEKRIRREIANSNERRRMQSINAGFQSLRTLLPHHEGEKLSKAAILQQTAEYIYQLEQEKTQLLSQNCQLKRLVNQHEGGDAPIKKRKAESQGVVVSLPMHVNESGDEGLGSMSPEPLSVITVSTEGHSVVNSEVVELRRQLERERHARMHLEKQMRAIQTQLYPERFRDNQLIAYQPHEVIEHTDNVMAQETEEAVAALQVVSVVSLPPVGSTQTVETSSPDPSPPMSPQPADMVPEEVKDERSRPASPKIVGFAQSSQVFPAIDDQATSDSFSPTSRVAYASSAADFKTTQFITASPSRPFSPDVEPQRLPSVLEAAMKAEPKVEVERLPSPVTSLDDGTPQARLYLANTSRQNLETIVEAIRHLEGDHLFSDEPAQDVPLALTNKPTAAPASSTKQRLLHAEVNNFLQFHSQQQTQQRPGVIVVKHS